ncbi:hypothetical protein DRP04_03940 [Archaeoglobales archaeon]|nr:MAG: hypothetical protein DRP04_03940 [Archaeoglobales archaeon]
MEETIIFLYFPEAGLELTQVFWAYTPVKCPRGFVVVADKVIPLDAFQQYYELVEADRMVKENRAFKLETYDKEMNDVLRYHKILLETKFGWRYGEIFSLDDWYIATKDPVKLPPTPEVMKNIFVENICLIRHYDVIYLATKKGSMFHIIHTIEHSEVAATLAILIGRYRDLIIEKREGREFIRREIYRPKNFEAIAAIYKIVIVAEFMDILMTFVLPNLEVVSKFVNLLMEEEEEFFEYVPVITKILVKKSVFDLPSLCELIEKTPVGRRIKVILALAAVA